MKRKCTLFLCIIMLFLSCALYFPADGAEFELPVLGEDLLGFTGNFNAHPQETGWSAVGGWDGVYISYVSDPLNAQNKCIRIEDPVPGGANPYVQKNFKVIPGATYCFNAKVYSDQPLSNNGEAYFNLVFNQGGAERAGSFKGNTDGTWKTISYTFAVPQDATLLQFAPRQKGQGYMYFDDISLVMVEAPGAVYVDTDEVFYYTDHTEMGVATAKINLKAYPSLRGKTIDFYLKKENEVIEEALSVSSGEDKAIFEFSVHTLEIKTEYTVEAQISGYTDSLCRAEWKIYRYARPLALDENGTYFRLEKSDSENNLTRTSEIITPVFAYRYRDYQFDIGKKNGITVAQLAMPQNKDGSYYSDEDSIAYIKNALDNAKEKGILLMLALYRNGEPAGSAKNIEFTKLVVQKFYNHEAVFAWMVMDETFSHFASPFDDLRASYVSIRGIDPYHPVYLCEATTRLAEAGKYTDILCVDPYPAPYRNDSDVYSAAATVVGERVALAVKAVNGRKPVYSLLQAFRWEPDHADYFPTGDEMRSMLYQSLIEGAAGIGYFKFDNSDGTTDLNETALWPYISEFASLEQDDAFNAFVYKKYPNFIDEKNDAYTVVSYIKENAIYMVVLNRLKFEQTVSISLAARKEAYKFKVECIAGSKDKTVNCTSTLCMNIPADGAALYKLTPQKTWMFRKPEILLFANCEKQGGKSASMHAKAYNFTDAPVRFSFAEYRTGENSQNKELIRIISKFTLRKPESFLLKTSDVEGLAEAKAFIWGEEMRALCKAELLN